jgi:pyruvate,orthophosphate dikinase
MAAGQQWVYDFSEGSKDMRDLLGGKGANVAEMTRVLGADRVPAGFTITTEACVAYMRAGQTEPDGMAEQVQDALERLQEQAGKRLGDGDDPLLVSVRSGARESMPGMLDTVLNLGLNDESVEGLARATENERFAWDSYRRFVQMFGNVSRGIPGEAFEDAIKQAKAQRCTESTPTRTSRRSPRSSCGSPSAPSSTRGRGVGRWSTGASTTFRTTGARRSTSSRWCSATRATRRAPASPSAATR